MKKTVEKIRDAFGIPSVSAAFYREGEIHTCAFGCGEDTRFAIGSCTKSFAAGTLLALEDRGMLSPDDRIRKYVPDLSLTEPETAKALTIRDILSHRSGFPGCDLAWYCRHDRFDREDKQKAISLLPQNAGCGERHQYNNLMFSLAGDVTEAVSGQSWDVAVREYLLGPLSIDGAAFSPEEAMTKGPVAVPYVRSGGKVSAVSHAGTGALAPAGSLYMTAAELLKWNVALLKGERQEGTSPLSVRAVREMTTDQISDAYGGAMPELAAAVRGRSYALGLQTELFRGERLIYHGGAIDGFLAEQHILPGKDFAAVLLTDLGGTYAREAFRYAVSGLLLEDETDWIGLFRDLQGREQEEIFTIENKIREAKVPEGFDRMEGQYAHPLFGRLSLALKAGVPWARLEDLPLPILEKGKGFAFFHPEFGLMEAEAICAEDGRAIALAISAEPGLDMKFRFERL